MKRSAPLRRVPFRRRPPTLVTLPGADDLVVTIERLAPGQFRMPARVDGVVRAFPKRDYVRSEALLEAVRRVPACQLCGRIFAGGERADPAHSNWSGHGKAGAIKADDNRIAALCRIPCHSWVDASGDDWLERFRAWWRAHERTVFYLTLFGLWPRGVPIPDVQEFPHALTIDST